MTPFIEEWFGDVLPTKQRVQQLLAVQVRAWDVAYVVFELQLYVFDNAIQTKGMRALVVIAKTLACRERFDAELTCELCNNLVVIVVFYVLVIFLGLTMNDGLPVMGLQRIAHGVKKS